MVDAASKDRLDPGLKRDLFFGDFAYTRRGVVSNLVGVVILSLGLLACLYAGGELRRFVFLTGSVVLTLGLHASRHAATVWRRGELRTPTDRGANPGPLMIERAFDRMRAQAEDDADLASDPRLALETRKARGLRILSRSAAALQRTVGAAPSRVEGRGQNSRAEGRGQERASLVISFFHEQRDGQRSRFLTSSLFPQILPSALDPWRCST